MGAPGHVGRRAVTSSPSAVLCEMEIKISARGSPEDPMGCSTQTCLLEFASLMVRLTALLGRESH